MVDENVALADYIGIPAMLEQTAEEATELAFACLKLARMIRGDNKVHNRTLEELQNNLTEETADILVCINEMYKCNLLDNKEVLSVRMGKVARMQKRLREADEAKQYNTTKEPNDEV